MSDFGTTVCDKCGARVIVAYGESGQYHEINRWVTLRDHHFCPACGEPILIALGGILDDIKRARRGQ